MFSNLRRFSSNSLDEREILEAVLLEIGQKKRQIRLKIPRFTPCGFKSHPPYSLRMKRKIPLHSLYLFYTPGYQTICYSPNSRPAIIASPIIQLFNSAPTAEYSLIRFRWKNWLLIFEIITNKPGKNPRGNYRSTQVVEGNSGTI